MLKWIATVKRRPEVSRADLLEMWETVHAPHVVAFAQPERYRVTFIDPERDGGTGLDGIAEVWFRDWDQFENTFGRNAPPERNADHFSDFADLQQGFQLFTTEHIEVDGPVSRDDVKLTFFVKRNDGVTQERLFQLWRDPHIPNVGAAVRATEAARRYTVSFADAGRDGPFDGVAEIWIAKSDATLGDLQGLQPDEFGNVVSVVTTAGHELSIVG